MYETVCSLLSDSLTIRDAIVNPFNYFRNVILDIRIVIGA